MPRSTTNVPSAASPHVARTRGAPVRSTPAARHDDEPPTEHPAEHHDGEPRQQRVRDDEATVEEQACRQDERSRNRLLDVERVEHARDGLSAEDDREAEQPRARDRRAVASSAMHMSDAPIA